MEIITKCEKCNRVLDSDMNGEICYVELCPDCIKAAKEESYTEGYDEGYKDGMKDHADGSP